jgi:hypothetical protein
MKNDDFPKDMNADFPQRQAEARRLRAMDGLSPEYQKPPTYDLPAITPVLARFRLAGLALRRIQCEYRAWLQGFSNKPGIPNWDAAAALVMDPLFPKNGRVVTEDDGCTTWMGHLVDQQFMKDEAYWRPLAGELADAILALQSEVEAAKKELG